MVTAVSSKTDSIANSTAKSQTALSQNYNDFLTLLTTQLKNQDPLDPQDASEFTSQIAQLSSVQEQINSNAKLDTLISTISGSQLSNVVNYIGRVVEAKGGNKVMKVTEGAQFAYDLPTEAASATIAVSDATGKVVYTHAVPTTAGRNEVVWDGTNSLTGVAAPNGGYTYKIIAKDSSGAELKATTYSTGVVTAVDLKDGVAILGLGEDIDLPLSEVTSIKTAQQLL
jgi:flagellar basal-body rod modification protein FlgD